MVDFRRCITALGLLAMFTGLASADQLSCNTNVSVPPALRGEGYTEQTGDITISCTGGVAPAPGGSIPLVNFTIFYNTTVTSRLLPITGTSSVQGSGQTSEALLLIDEPGSGLGTYGAGLGQTLCTTPLTGCAAWVGNVAGSTFNTAVNGAPNATSLLTTATPSPNVYQGVVNGNSVTFFGVPVLPPATTGSRVFRILNVRVNAQPLSGLSASGGSPVQASISISGATSLGLQNTAPVVGYVSSSLTASAGSSANLNQCSTQTRSSIQTLTFTENFGTAFKTRVNASLASQNTAYAGQRNDPSPSQNVPGAIYNSESNFIFPISGTQVAGLADFGTRLKATFNNIPSGASIFVSTSNVNNNAFTVTPPAVIGGSAANSNVSGAYVGYAQLINGETTSDGNAGVSGFFPAVTATDNGPNNGNVPIAQVSIANGTGSAVWEVVNTNPNTNESFKFAVYISYSANVAQNAPLPGTATINLSYAPTATSGAASSSLPIPRFANDASAARNIFNVNICRTVLLYPYILNQIGLDTGLAIANTSQDSFTVGGNATAAQSGECTLTMYPSDTTLAQPPAFKTGIIKGAATWTGVLSTMAPNFQGYMFAVCNFQFAHGFAFISDNGIRNLAMGYLAVVLNDPGTGSRGNANTTSSENGGH
jgi:hypothetical protein